MRDAARDHDDGTGSDAAAKEVCLRLLTERARSRAELEQRLAKRGYASDTIERVLSRLETVELVDDAAFARQWVHSRHRYSGRGRIALASELRRKGIDETVAREALDEVTVDDECERARELVRARLARVSGAEVGENRDRWLRRLVGLLARRGYPASMAFEVSSEQLAELTRTEDAGFDPL